MYEGVWPGLSKIARKTLSTPWDLEIFWAYSAHPAGGSEHPSRSAPVRKTRFHSGGFSPQVMTLLDTCAPITGLMIKRIAPLTVATICELIVRKRWAGFPLCMF